MILRVHSFTGNIKTAQATAEQYAAQSEMYKYVIKNTFSLFRQLSDMELPYGRHRIVQSAQIGEQGSQLVRGQKVLYENQPMLAQPKA